ncbi:hypothetical protein SELMODRAFT_132317 [Selaginella moellendorffii]|uniref:Pentacotripeptide-repeat region of PRORP domain-containing protein n=1 Tax=Selaginella moellendorffii TaxID=88036 RepID=D8T5J6_SELML|nr:hypothetical protein SELMODRAFT_132317 [Selaginella moellendorffii]
MYGRCRSVIHARQAFDRIENKSVISWNSIITAYAQNGHSKEALGIFFAMDPEGVKPNRVTFLAALDACSIETEQSSNLGREIHFRIIESGLESEETIANSLVNMYANFYGRCGNLKEAKQAFSMAARRDVISWTAMVSAFAHHGWGEEALEIFHAMILDGVLPNSVTLLSILSACSHSGLLKTAREKFVSMEDDFGIHPLSDHYDCLVDSLGRAGRIGSVEEMLEFMPFHPGAVVWMSYLSASKVLGDFVRGERAARMLLDLDPGNCAAYLVVSNMYVSTENEE